MIYFPRMAIVYIGTSGFSYRDWVGPFYPPELPAADRLHFYCQRFAFLELNSTYYRIPEEPSMQALLARARGGGLRSLVVKAPGDLTHRGVDRPRRGSGELTASEAVQRTRAGMQALAGDPLFSGMLLQFPFSFRYTPGNRRYLGWLLDELGPTLEPASLMVEFRHRSWERASVWRGLVERGAQSVAVDLPSLEGLPGTITGPLGPAVSAAELPGYVRLHGRRADTWWSGDSTTRYDYEYSDTELREIATAVAGLAQSIDRAGLYVAFNNHFAAQAVRNAISLRRMLAERGIETALPLTRND